MFGKPFDNAHNGMADVRALQHLMRHTKVMKDVELTSCNTSSGRKLCDYVWAGNKRLPSLEPLYKGPRKQIKKGIAIKIANSGLSYHHLLAVYKHGGEEALVTLCKDTSGGTHRISKFSHIHEQLCTFFSTLPDDSNGNSA